jgi:hypothetical protein
METMVSDAYTAINELLFTTRMKEDGWIILPDVLSSDFISILNDDLAHAYNICRDMQVKKGLSANTDGSVHHLIGLSDNFLKLLEYIPIWNYVRHYFGGNFILNSLGGIINLPSGATYASRVHRDIRTFSGDMPLMLNMLIMLDDFTVENGATRLLSGSHTKLEKPTDEVFFASAAHAVGRAGSILLFNANLWHAAGHNMTTTARRCLTPTFTKPFIKQQCDYPRVLGYEYANKLSEEMKQILGYNARVPASLDEWYQPPDKRMYKAGQE